MKKLLELEKHKKDKRKDGNFKEKGKNLLQVMYWDQCLIQT